MHFQSVFQTISDSILLDLRSFIPIFGVPQDIVICFFCLQHRIVFLPVSYFFRKICCFSQGVEFCW